MFRALLAAATLASLAACVAPGGPYADNQPYGYNTGHDRPYHQSHATPPWQRPDLAHSNWDRRAP